jgi:hypothetical protein
MLQGMSNRCQADVERITDIVATEIIRHAPPYD